MSLASRFATVCALLVFGTALAIVVLLRPTIEGAVLPVAMRSLAQHAHRLVEELDGHVEASQDEVRTFRDSPLLADVLRALDEDPSSLEAARRRAGEHLVALMAHRPEILQVRFLGVDPPGLEVIRVDRSSSDGAPRIVRLAELQDKRSRDYYLRALAVPRGAIYVSRIELNQEYGKIEIPHQPTLRIAAPVDTAKGRAGVVVLNLDISRVFERIRASSPAGEVYVVNEDGDYLLHPDPKMVFGFQLGTRHRIQDDLSADVLTGDRAVLETRRGPLAVATKSWHVHGGPRSTVVEIVPLTTLLSILGPLRDISFAVGGAAAGIAIVLAILMSRTLTRPLEGLTEAVVAFGSGRDRPLRVGDAGGPELRALAAAFGRMRQTIHERNNVLMRQEANFRRVVDRAPYGMVVIDEDARIAHLNIRAKTIFDDAREALVGDHIRGLLPELNVVEDIAAIGGHDGPHEIRGVRPDGSTVLVQVERTELHGAEGWHTLVSIVDLSERERAEQRFQRVVEAAPNATLVFDDSQKITLVNRATETLLDRPREALLGQPIDLLVPERSREDHERFLREFRENLEEEPVTIGRDLFVQRRDGHEIPVEIGLATIEGSKGSSTLASIVDMTEHKRRELELRRSNAELEQFAYVASHDLQEPLRMVANYTELLAKRYRGKLDEKADKYIFYAVDGARRMQSLVADLLAFSRVGSQGRPLVPVELTKVVDGVVRSIATRIRKEGATIAYDDLPAVLGDEGQLRQVFQNLIGNALKFRTEAPPVVRIEAVSEQSLWRVSVSDNGIGIEPEYADRIFQMFQRLHARGAYEGSGIGLAITKRIIERHGGSIWLDENEAGGACFFLTLPRVEEVTT